VHPAHPAHAYEGGPLCGAGVSWKVASALLRDARSSFSGDADHAKWLLDLAVIGTVADMVPLRGENRTIVQFGLEILRRTRRPGLVAFLSMLTLERSSLSAEDIAWRLAPRLNAAGRMDHAQPALDLLLTRDSRHAEELVRQLEYLNRQRQTVTLKMLQEVETSVSAKGIIFAYNPRWRAGVVGLAAGRLADKYGRPAVVIGTNGRHAVGSARSPSSVNVLELLEQGREYLLALGGHAQAAGFSLTEEKMAEFQERLLNSSRSLSAAAPAGASIDVVLDPVLLTTTTLALVDTFAPFGEGNPRPIMLVQNLHLTNWRPVGKSGDHIKFTWDVGGQELGGIGFGLATQMTGFDQGMVVDVVGTLETNEWRGQRSLQLSVQDVAPAGSVELGVRL
jgi:single-stranded-DNA-specific exonuclease